MFLSLIFAADLSRPPMIIESVEDSLSEKFILFESLPVDSNYIGANFNLLDFKAFGFYRFIKLIL